jgi:hypothetical protein
VLLVPLPLLLLLGVLALTAGSLPAWLANAELFLVFRCSGPRGCRVVAGLDRLHCLNTTSAGRPRAKQAALTDRTPEADGSLLHVDV